MEEEKRKQSAEQRFLAEVRREIKWQAAWPSIHAELSDHLASLKADLLEAGATPEEAQVQAVAAMGDGAEIGRELNGLHRPQLAKGLLALSGVLAVLGLATLFYAFALGYRMQLRGTLCGLVLGLAVAAALYFSDYSKWLKWSPAIYGAGVVLMLHYIMSDNPISGAFRYLHYGSGDGYMLAAILFVVSVAGCLELWRSKGVAGLCGCGALAIVAVFLMISRMQTYLTLMLGIWYVVLFAKAIAWKYFGGNIKRNYAILSGAVIIVLVVFPLRWLISRSYFAERLTVAVWARNRALQTLQQAKWWGQADVSGLPTSTYMDNPSILIDPMGDFTFMRIINDCGLLAGIAVLLGLLLLIYVSWRKMSQIKNHYGQMLGLSAVAFWGSMILGHILVNAELMFWTRICLPFFTIGGSNMLVSWALVGMVLAIWRRNTILTDSHLLGKEENDLADSHSLGSKGNGEQDRQIITYDDGILTIDCRRWLDSKKTSEQGACNDEH